MKKQLNEFIAAVTAEDSAAFVLALENHVRISYSIMNRGTANLFLLGD